VARKKRKAENGAGSAYQRKDTGKWKAELVLGVLPDGKRDVLRSPPFATQDEAEDWLDERKGERVTGTLVSSSKTTLGDFLMEWLETVVDLRCKPTTQYSYRGIVTAHLVPRFGKVKLADLSAQVVQRYLKELHDKGRSAYTIRNIQRVLHVSLEHAREQKLVRENVAKVIKPPRPSKKPPPVFTFDDARRILEVSKDERFHAAFVLLLYYGLRIGEVLGLHWSSIDFEQGTVTISHQLNQTGGKLILQDVPKTDASFGVLDMPASVAGVLKKWKTDQAKERLRLGGDWVYPDLVFTTQIGTHYSPNNFRKRDYKRVLDAAGVSWKKVHSLRHTSITAMGEAGLTVNEAQQIARHSKPSVTTDIYRHVFRDKKREASNTISDFWERDEKSRGI
jgi:integrase